MLTHSLLISTIHSRADADAEADYESEADNSTEIDQKTSTFPAIDAEVFYAIVPFNHVTIWAFCSWMLPS